MTRTTDLGLRVLAQSSPSEPRDALSWLVDLSTVGVGLVAVATLLLTYRASSSKSITKAWDRQVALEHHARIYGAAAQLLQATSAWTRVVRARVQARGSAEVDMGYGPDADESVDHRYAALVDTGATRPDVEHALDECIRSLDLLYFLIARDGPGARLLDDLVLIGNAFGASRPRVGQDAGNGSLQGLLDSSGLEADVALIVDTADLDADGPMRRIKFIDNLVAVYFRGRIGRYVPPPPIART